MTVVMCQANQWTGIYMIETSVMKELISVLNFPFHVFLFNFADSIFQIRGPKTVTLSSEFRIGTLRLSLCFLEFNFSSEKLRI